MDDARGDNQPVDKSKAARPTTDASRAATARFEALRTFGQLGAVGLSFVIALVLGAAAGWWLDRLTGWSPLFFVLFFLLGAVAGGRNVYFTAKKFIK